MRCFQCMFDALGATPSLDTWKEPTAILGFNILCWESSCFQGILEKWIIFCHSADFPSRLGSQLYWDRFHSSPTKEIQCDCQKIKNVLPLLSKMYWKIFSGDQADFQFWSSKMLLSVLLHLSPVLVTCINLEWGEGVRWIHAPGRSSLMAGKSSQRVVWPSQAFCAVWGGKATAAWPWSAFIAVAGRGHRGCGLPSIAVIRALGKLSWRPERPVQFLCTLEPYLCFSPEKLILLVFISVY